MSLTHPRGKNEVFPKAEVVLLDLREGEGEGEREYHTKTKQQNYAGLDLL
jgi:hypothetical protein